MKRFRVFLPTAAPIVAFQLFSLSPVGAQDAPKYFFSQDFAKPSQEGSKLCGQRVPGKANVVVGAFPLTGNSVENQAKNLDLVFSGVIVGSLGAAGNALPTVWDPADRQLANSRLQVEALLAQGGSGRDKQSERAINDIAEFLKAQNCDYLVGGKIAQDSKLLIATPFIFNVEKKEFAEDMNPIVQETSLLPNRAAESFAAQFARYIQTNRSSSATSGQQVAVSCFTAPPADKVKGQGFVLDDTIDAIQRVFTKELSASGRISGQVVKASSGFCASPQSADLSSETVAVFGGAVESKDGQFALRLSARAIEQRSRKSFEISLTPSNDGFIVIQAKSAGDGDNVSQPKSAVDYGALGSALERLKRIVAAGVTVDGIVFPGRDIEIPTRVEALSDLLTSRLDEGKNEEALTLGFKALSSARDNPIALLAIARAFINKSDAVAGANFLSSALAGREKVPDAVLGPFLEGAGNAYRSAGLNTFAVKMFNEALDVFRRQNRENDIGRLVRLTAQLFLKSGKPEDARRTLLPQAEVKSDPDAIAAIGQLDFARGNVNSAVEWFTKGNTLNPGDSRFKDGLVSTYRILGRNASAEQKYAEAAVYFQRGLQYGEDGESLYRSGVAYGELGMYDKAIEYYERVLRIPEEKEYFRWAESAWLNVLECYLLTEQWDKVLSRGTIAMQSALAGKNDSQLLALYLQSIAVGLKSPDQAVEDFRGSEPYKKYDELRKFASPGRLAWKNTAIESFLERRQGGNPATMEAVRKIVYDVTGALGTASK